MGQPIVGDGSGGLPGVTGTGTGGSSGVAGISDSGFAVTGLSTSGDGVSGTNGAGSGTTPKFGCGVRGQSANGYGVYGASETASGVYGTSGPSHLAGEFAGDVSITGSLGVVVATVSGTLNAPGVLTGNVISGIQVLTTEIVASGNSSVGGNHTVGGNVSVTGNHTVGGSVSVAGDVVFTGQDCAEQFDSADPEASDPGTVLVIDATGLLRRSDKAYDRRVAGVVSGAGDFRPGIILGGRGTDGRTTVALVGKVYCKVDASFGSIEVGDLLTSSATPGHAMKVTDPLKGFGSVIGKALRPLSSGRGLVPILVALQ